MNELSQKIISKLPYGEGFLFVDEITYVDDNRIVGNYTFRADAPYYKWHFKHKPVTPGVLLIECMGQIGLVCHWVYIASFFECNNALFIPSLSYVEVSFLNPINVGEKVLVEGLKMYYRAGVFKSNIILRDLNGNECLKAIAQLKVSKYEK